MNDSVTRMMQKFRPNHYKNKWRVEKITQDSVQSTQTTSSYSFNYNDFRAYLPRKVDPTSTISFTNLQNLLLI